MAGLMNNELKLSGRKQQWPNFRHYPSLEGLTETTTNLSQGSRYPGQHLNEGRHEYEAAA
jgi:hypothetical protein